MERVVVLLALVVLSGGCGDASRVTGGPGASSTPSPEDPESGTPDPNGPAPSPTRSFVDPQPGQADVRMVQWDDYARRTPRTLEVTYWSGVEPCYVLDSVEVKETDRQVTITLFEGHSPMDEDVACIEIAVQKTVVVELERPVGGRKVVDGARGGV